MAAYVSVHRFGWMCPGWLIPPVQKALVFAMVALVCWKPANLFVKETLQYNRVSFPADDSNSFHAGKLIGTLERWLILVFILIGRYEVIGFLIAAKSIIRFGEGKKGEEDKDRTEYFLAGTLLSIAIAVGCGLLVKVVCCAVGD